MASVVVPVLWATPCFPTVLPIPLAFPSFCFCEHVPLSPMTTAEETKVGRR